MPQWLINALRTQTLSETEKAAVLIPVASATEQHDKQAARIAPTDEDLLQRFNI